MKVRELDLPKVFILPELARRVLRYRRKGWSYEHIATQYKNLGRDVTVDQLKDVLVYARRRRKLALEARQNK